MNDPVYQNLLETSWRRKLTPDEQTRLQSFLSAHPEAAAEWRTEAALSGLLGRLPDPPPASNFTAQIMRAVEAEQARRAGRSELATRWGGWRKALWPKAAWAGAALLLGLALAQEYRFLNRSRIARDLAKIPVVATLPAPEVLQDFDSIRQFSRVSLPSRAAPTVSDDDLLTALQ